MLKPDDTWEGFIPSHSAPFSCPSTALKNYTTHLRGVMCLVSENLRGCEVVQQHVRSLRDLADGELLLQIMRDINPQDRRFRVLLLG